MKKARVKKLIELGDRKLASFSMKQVGKNSQVLFERRVGEYMLGHTSNYLKIRVKTPANLKNEIRTINLKEFNGESLIGMELQ